ncbi:MAG: anhydro-N-acetylmuramic acid kinase [Rhodoferax sp.]|nr:anhydro-N-acetylmuramic acid kinase [Rhodoferax sp.]
MPGRGADLYIGLMSGTSLDGVDGVLADFSSSQVRVVAHCSAPFPAELRAELMALNTPGVNELHRAALAGNSLARLYATVVASLLDDSGATTSQVSAVGAHGQTVRHRPQEFDGTGYTLQLNQPALLAELCNIPVVADFRGRDVAAGGQGAPLVPPFHAALFSDTTQSVAVLNIGGISNVTLLPCAPPPEVSGYDCGPGNALMDAWCQQHTGAAYDDGGRWAASGWVIPELLHSMLSDPFFAKVPPKSTGRDLFNALWLQRQLASVGACSPVDVQATLTELTALSCAQAAQRTGWAPAQLLVCGGGALNAHLMTRIAAALPGWDVVSTEQRGLPPLQVEAAAFAWLARQTCLGATGSLPKVTGAQGARVLGSIYPA